MLKLVYDMKIQKDKCENINISEEEKVTPVKQKPSLPKLNFNNITNQNKLTDQDLWNNFNHEKFPRMPCEIVKSRFSDNEDEDNENSISYDSEKIDSFADILVHPKSEEKFTIENTKKYKSFTSMLSSLK